MPSQQQPAPWTVYREYVYPIHPCFLVCLIQHRALAPLKYGDALWSIFFIPHCRKPNLIPVVGSLVLSTATTELDQAMSGTLAEDGSTFYSLREFHWDRGSPAPMFLLHLNLWTSAQLY